MRRNMCEFKCASSHRFCSLHTAGLWVENDLIVLTSNDKNATAGTHEAHGQGCSHVLCRCKKNLKKN